MVEAVEGEPHLHRQINPKHSEGILSHLQYHRIHNQDTVEKAGGPHVQFNEG